MAKSSRTLGLKLRQITQRVRSAKRRAQQAEATKYHKEELLLANHLIAELPKKLQFAAAEGKLCSPVMVLQSGHVGKGRRLGGAAALVARYCRMQGLRVRLEGNPPELLMAYWD